MNPRRDPRLKILKDGLTRRERELVWHLAWGEVSAYKDIAQVMGVSHKTVQVYAQTCLAKLGLRNRTELMTWGRENLKDGDRP